MSDYFFRHPKRFPKNVEGPFYTTGEFGVVEEGNPPRWCGDCLWCGAPEAEAPELFAPFNESYTDTYFVRQPETADEARHAIEAARVCCVFAVRYGGDDRDIIRALGNDPSLCDYVIGENDDLMLTVAPDGEFFPFARKIVEAKTHPRKWWQFWR